MTNAKPESNASGTKDILNMHAGEAVCASAEETLELGRRFAGAIPAGAILSLEGPLGAGKTQFAKGFAAARGHAGEVCSPTFTLLHEYGGVVVHFDWYRLETAEDVIGIGWEDYVTCGTDLLIEWGDRHPELLPPGSWRIRFVLQGAARRVSWGRVR